LLGEVEDAEGLKEVLWLKGIRQWRSGLGGLLGGGRHSPPVAARLREGDSEEKMVREREGGVSLVFTMNTCARDVEELTGMDATRWLTPKLASRVVRWKPLNMTESRPG
jgi:hypothetical protein